MANELTLTLNEYQATAETTAVYPDQGSMQGMIYVALGMANEAGEFAGKVKKILRDSDGKMTAEAWDALEAELGDVLWYVANAATELGVNLSWVAQGNLNKLAGRAERDTIKGSGDIR